MRGWARKRARAGFSAPSAPSASDRRRPGIRASAGAMAPVLPLALALALSVFSLEAAGKGQTSAEKRSEPERLSEESVYQIEGVWRDQNGKEVALPALRGKKQVTAMIYANCLNTCPVIVQTMKDVERKLPDRLKPRVGFVLVSLTPDVDTPKALKDFAVRRGVADRWVLLTGDEGQTRALANALNIQYRRLKDGEVAHSNAITLLDEEGRIETQAAGLRSAMRKILNTLGATESNAPAVKPVKADAASSKSVKP